MSDKIWPGHTMTREDVLELTGQNVDPNIFTVHPTGNLIHVLLEEVPEEIGMIRLPDSVRDRERMGVGYIIAAGPRAGHPDYATALTSPVGVVRTGLAEDLLGLHVIFGATVGMPLRVNLLDREFKSAVLVMSTKDIRGVDMNPEALSKRAGFSNESLIVTGD